MLLRPALGTIRPARWLPRLPRAALREMCRHLRINHFSGTPRAVKTVQAGDGRAEQHPSARWSGGVCATPLSDGR